MSECGPDCQCEDAQRRRLNALASKDLSAVGSGPSARYMNESVESYPSSSEPFTITSGPFKGRVYRVNEAGQRVRQRQLERTARL